MILSKFNLMPLLVFLFSILFYFAEYALIARSIFLFVILIFLIFLEGKTDKLFISYVSFAFLYLINLSFFEQDYYMKSFSLFYPIFSYWVGMFFGRFFKNENSLLRALFLISLVLSSYYIISILIDIYVNGFLGGGRSIKL